MERRFISCYDNWIHIQKSDLSDLLRTSSSPGTTETELREIVNQSMRHYEDYSERRRLLVLEDGPTFFSAPRCSSFENWGLWIGGCRPSLAIGLLYSVTGSEMEAHLDEFLQGQRDLLASVGLMGLTACQLQMVNDLHQRTLLAEDRLLSRLATVQEDVADKPLLPILRERKQASSSNTPSSSSTIHLKDGESTNKEVDMATQHYAEGLTRLVAEADKLRVATVKTLLTEILAENMGTSDCTDPLSFCTLLFWEKYFPNYSLLFHF